MALVENEASSGTLLLAGEDVNRFSGDRRTALRNQAIGLIFQGCNRIAVLTA